MKYLFIIICLIFALETKAATVPSDSGSFQYVGNQTITFIDSSRSDRSIQSLVYYPAISEGIGTAINLSGGKYPIISFGHGFTINPNVYIHLYRHLASWGYIVIAPATETSFFPSHIEFARDLAFVLRDMKRKSKLPADFFFNSVDTVQTGIFGHSMGGGCSFLAGSLDTTVKAISSLAAAITNPSSITAIQQIQRPVQLLSGQRDSIASYWTHQLPHYNAANPFKQILNIKGGNHSYFHLLPALDDLVDNPATITRNEQQKLTRRYITSFFNVFLKNDTNYRNYLFGSIAQSDTSIIMQYQLPFVTGLKEKIFKSYYFELKQNYPNPFNPVTTIAFSIPKSSFIKIIIYNILGKEITKIVNQKMEAGNYLTEWNASEYPSGVYFYRLETSDFTDTKRMILVK
ncbi:MAG: T9SS type A sorting domain-containing protein [Ignavibacteria bacterium]|nr:T9SS type A sorting domain-containing protein [Ignavibacteria bacterium]